MMGFVPSGFFSGTQGSLAGKHLYQGQTKSSAIKATSNLPSEIQKSAKDFFKGGSNKYDYFSVQKYENGYLLRMEKPGNVPGSRAVYYKVLDLEGNTVLVYKETFDPKGNLVHTKVK